MYAKMENYTHKKKIKNKKLRVSLLMKIAKFAVNTSITKEDVLKLMTRYRIDIIIIVGRLYANKD
jgi:3-dehydroquinate synthetase